jgi:hypothetical protein
MNEIAAQSLPWIALAAIVLGLVAGAAVLGARSLFSICIGVAALCACAAAALLALGYGDGALALVLLGVGVAPVMLLGGVLLSSRAVKPRPRGWPWLSIAAAFAAAIAMLWAAPALDLDQEVATPRGGVSIALAALVFAAIAACVGLLGYGERGVLGKGRDT